MQPIIQIRGLGKKYQLVDVQPYLALRDAISYSVKNIFNRRNHRPKEFWALQNIDLDIQPGDRVGIIGRNGAGKSTLLKILSRITPPTTGSVFLHGRVASLLEVGTGFHPELTGRENIFLNGSILGLKKKEIDQKLGEIIEFSGVEKFIDMPLKHYSSGMQLRLAFSVAAHLEPEILLIDEVLAVGDMEFQKKCLGKMEEVSKADGRTILFVSHNLTQLKHLCNTAILLENGRIHAHGRVDEVIKKYSEIIFVTESYHWKNENPARDFAITDIILKNDEGLVNKPLKTNENLYLEVSLKAKKNITDSQIAIRFTNQENIPVYTTTNADHDMQYPTIQSGEHIYRVPIPVNLFTPGRYSMIIAWNIPNIEALHKVDNVMQIDIEDDRYPGDLLRDGRLGILNKIIRWEKIS
jgi:lipopolysaccharide transport system ATP-binding protein